MDNKNNFLYGSEIIERFCKNEKVFIASNIGDRKDLDIVSYVANVNRNQKCILVPHVISEESLNEIISSVEGTSLLFSECAPETDFDDIQVLIIDFLGALPIIYKYCYYVYVGVGDMPYGNSIVEATAFGLPVAFRPKIYQKSVHAELVNFKIGSIVRNSKELAAWLESLKSDEGIWDDIHNIALNYAKENCRATD